MRLDEERIEIKHEDCNLNFKHFLSITKVIKCIAANLQIMEKCKGEQDSTSITIVKIF